MAIHKIVAAAVFGTAVALAGTAAARAPDCPNGGTVRFGVEPYDTSAKLVPIYDHIGKLLAAKLDCEVQILVTTNYTAEIEAMRVGKLEGGEFGPLGYIFAHELAKAEAVAAFSDKAGKPATYWASIVTWPGSGIKTLADVKGRSFAYSDPASTSGHLFPAYAFRKAGIDPDTGIKPVYAGSHTSAFEALRNHKVEAGELNSQQIESATQRGAYKDGDVVFLWKSGPIPNDPLVVRSDLPEGFKKRFIEVLQNFDLSELPEADRKIINAGGTRLVPEVDASYAEVRDLVKTLNIDIKKLDE